jgi:osmotically-inducible protein OsmY
MKCHPLGLLVLCIAVPACNKHKASVDESQAAALEAQRQADAAALSTRAQADEAALRAREAEARMDESERLEMPAHAPKDETAAAHGMEVYGEGARPPGTLPGEGIPPGSVRSVTPSQGTLEAMPQAAGEANTETATGSTRGDIEQGTSESDRGMTQRIRRALLEDESLSFTAKNIQIITRNGNVTLRGLVLSDKEKKMIDQLAHNYVGGGKVTNLLELKSLPETK